MVMLHFTFYPFGECYFFSETTAGDEGFFFNNDLTPMCSERGFQAISKIYITKNLISILQTYFGPCNLAINCQKNKPWSPSDKNSSQRKLLLVQW